MSWFKRKPTPKAPLSQSYYSSHRTSPASDRILRETKEAVRPLKKDAKK